MRSPKSLITFWTLVGFVLTPDTIIYLLISLFYFSHRFPCSPDRIDMPPDHSTPSPTIATPLYHFICPRDRHCTSCMTYAYSCFALSYLTSLYYLLIRFHYFTDPIYYLLMIYSSYYRRRHITILVVFLLTSLPSLSLLTSHRHSCSARRVRHCPARPTGVFCATTPSPAPPPTPLLLLSQTNSSAPYYHNVVWRGARPCVLKRWRKVGPSFIYL